MDAASMLTAISFLTLATFSAGAADFLVETEGFDELGGWVLDSQFVDIMGSPYLLAHGQGSPVANAKTKVSFAEKGTYFIWVRTKDWVSEPEWAPGRFKIAVDGTPLSVEFGVTGGGAWTWQYGGKVEILSKSIELELRDLTGFDGRCDAILFSTNKEFVPPEKPGRKMRDWRKKLMGLSDDPPSAGDFDVVVVGGGISGCSAALAAARLGCRVALVQNRPVSGGNASPEIGVYGPRWGKPGPFITGEIFGLKGTREIEAYHPGAADRQRVLDGESNIHQFLGWHVFKAHTDANRMTSVDALNITSNQELRFTAPLFIDATGDGCVGYLAGADYRYGSEGRDDNHEPLAPEKPSTIVLGATLHWNSAAGDKAVAFPDVPWAEAVSRGYSDTGGNWTWEYGHYRDMINEAEEIRDYLLRSIYGAFATAQRTDPGKLATYELSHVAYILGKRESRRLLGDYIMTQMDCWDTPTKPDKVAISNNPFDVHMPRKDYDFRIYVDERYGGLGKRKDADIPFRSLYSRNVSNLMMAGRCISVTHIAHSSTRVMNTGSQTGIAVGAAAYLCTRYNTTPREVGKEHITELQDIVFARGKYADALKSKK